MLKFHPLRVRDVRPEADDAVALTVDVPDALRGEFRSRPGQHVVVRAFMNGEEVRRTYSLTNVAGELPLQIVVRSHPVGRLSRHIASLGEGATLELMPPNGSFAPHTEGQGGTFVAFAAGCGITPVISIIRSLLTADPQCRVLLFYGNRAGSRTMLLEELLALKDRFVDRLSLHFVMSREPQEIELLNGRLDADRVREFAGRLFDAKAVREYFICGPGTMIGTIGETLRSLGVDAQRIHSEHFAVSNASAASSAAPETVKGPSDAAAGVTQVAVTMDGRRRSFTMRTGSESILDAAGRAGIDLPFSCKAGVCSTCRTKLVRGEVTLAENYALEDWELQQGFILACQAHAKTPELELDYDAK
jgi:ring-1,2-phenylacetyl-CoA epoxidase subunit PaaE